MVVDRDPLYGFFKLIGLITGETVAEMMMLREALPRGARMGPWGRAAGA